MNYNNIIKECNSLSDFCKKINFNVNGSGYKKAKKIILDYNLDISHFDNGVSKKVKHIEIKKICPVCKNEFFTKNNKREKTVCSRSCSNTYFRSGVNNANYKSIDNYNNRSSQFAIKYRKICFENHEHKCVVCGENKILDVHHFDGNKFNNDVNNLIPICATHHNYLHSKYKDEIIDKVIEYINNWNKNK